MEFDLKIIVALAAVVIILGTAGAYFWTVSNKPTHTVTVQIIGNGKVNLGTSGAYTTLIQVVDGQSLGLTALPDQGWSFYSWSGDLTGTTNPINVVVTKDLRIVATFAVS